MSGDPADMDASYAKEANSIQISSISSAALPRHRPWSSAASSLNISKQPMTSSSHKPSWTCSPLASQPWAHSASITAKARRAGSYSGSAALAKALSSSPARSRALSSSTALTSVSSPSHLSSTRAASAAAASHPEISSGQAGSPLAPLTPRCSSSSLSFKPRTPARAFSNASNTTPSSALKSESAPALAISTLAFSPGSPSVTTNAQSSARDADDDLAMVTAPGAFSPQSPLHEMIPRLSELTYPLPPQHNEQPAADSAAMESLRRCSAHSTMSHEDGDPVAPVSRKRAGSNLESNRHGHGVTTPPQSSAKPASQCKVSNSLFGQLCNAITSWFDYHLSSDKENKPVNSLISSGSAQESQALFCEPIPFLKDSVRTPQARRIDVDMTDVSSLISPPTSTYTTPFSTRADNLDSVSTIRPLRIRKLFTNDDNPAGSPRPRPASPAGSSSIYVTPTPLKSLDFGTSPVPCSLPPLKPPMTIRGLDRVSATTDMDSLDYNVVKSASGDESSAAESETIRRLRNLALNRSPVGVLTPSERTNMRRMRLRKQREAEEKARIAADLKAQKAAAEAARLKALKESKKSTKKAKALRIIPPEKYIQPLSPDWEDRLDAVLERAPTSPVTTSCGGNEISAHDFATVLGCGEWLNDEIINGYIDWVVDAANKRAGLTNKLATPKFVAQNSFFYSRLVERGPSSVSRWMKRKRAEGAKLLDVQQLFIPVNNGVHWTLLVVSPIDRQIEYLDSLDPTGAKRAPHVAVIKKWLEAELGSRYVESEWQVLTTSSVQQINGSDCGVFTVTNCQAIAEGVSTSCFTGVDMAVQRRRIAAVLLNKGFVGEFTRK